MLTDWSPSHTRPNRFKYIRAFSSEFCLCQWLRVNHYISLGLSLAFCSCLYNGNIKYKCSLCRAFRDLWETVLKKTFSIYYLQDTSPSLKSRFVPEGLLFSCAWASVDMSKQCAEYLSTYADAFFSMSQSVWMPPFVRSQAVMARPRGGDVPELSIHFCHVSCRDKQEGIFNRRHFLCGSGKALGWWPSRHSAKPICFPRRWRVFKWCRWGHFVWFFGTVRYFCYY